MDFVYHEPARFAEEELDNGAHVLLIGDKGAAKSMFATHYAKKKNRPHFMIECEPYLEPNDVIGGLGVKDGMWQHNDKALTMAMEQGGVLELKELAVLKASVAHIFHAAANGEPLAVRTDSGDRYLEPHPEFRIIATMNGDTYAGNNRLSDATIDRFTVIRWQYLDPEDERDLLMQGTSAVPVGVVNDLIDLATTTRNPKNDVRPISTRALRSCVAMLERGRSLEQVVVAKILTPAELCAPETVEALENMVTGKLTIDPVLLKAGRVY